MRLNAHSNISKTYLEEPVDAAHRKLEASLDGSRRGLLLVAALHGALGAFAGEAFAGKSFGSLARHVVKLSVVGECVKRVWL